ncbi:BCCT family transporter [Echinicola salinicaeni]|uniref:BCCT family transporter n=1 Tax=Echinicola salinicaeni TaxID=2762757 RepID=UPI001647F4C1|nr:BCCT family transporter [Echinicola salinicaeni]
MKNQLKTYYIPLRKSVFWPPFILISLAVSCSWLASDFFEDSMNSINQFILDHFSIIFSYTAFAMVITCCLILCSPLAKIKIGGKDAKPKFNRLSWFSIILCTTVAVGILFWGSAEPLFHYLYPPEFKDIPNNSSIAANFSMGAVFLHWGFTPYAIYCIPALGIALAVYNAEQKFSLSSPLAPLLGKNKLNQFSSPIDTICLFALVAGMSASLGAGILSISGGIQNQWPNWDKAFIRPTVTLLIISTFILSASSGINRGIKRLSQINFYIFIIFSLFILTTGPSQSIFHYAIEGASHFLTDFIPISLQFGNIKHSPWLQSWTIFNWANWMAWAPITALFLGKIAYGRTVREFILFNWILPAIFCLIWMSILGGSTLFYAENTPLTFKNLLENNGPESIIYQVFAEMGNLELLTPAFTLAMFISYVTAADSNTEAMASLSMKNYSIERFDSDTNLKVTWGTLVGLLAWVMITFAGIEGVKILSSLGGLPALFLLIGITISMLLLIWKPSKYLKK